MNEEDVGEVARQIHRTIADAVASVCSDGNANPEQIVLDIVTGLLNAGFAIVPAKWFGRSEDGAASVRSTLQIHQDTNKPTPTPG